MGHDIIYAISWRASHGIWYGLADFAWYMVWPDEVCDGIWKGIVLHALRYCHGLYSPVHTWSGPCQLEILFTRTGPVHKYRAFYMHVSFTRRPVHSGQ